MAATFHEAVEKAKRLAKKNDKEYFVLLSEEPEVEGKYAVASSFDLDTFYLGLAESRILYSTIDGYVEARGA